MLLPRAPLLPFAVPKEIDRCYYFVRHGVDTSLPVPYRLQQGRKQVDSCSVHRAAVGDFWCEAPKFFAMRQPLLSSPRLRLAITPAARFA
jgi:hypothetical protein